MTRKILAKRSATNSGGISDLSGATEDALLSDIMSFVPGSVAAHKDEENDEEKWYNAVRPVATLFVNLGLDDSALALAASDDTVLKEVHEVLAAVQTAVYQYEGAINKFLLDDKGGTLISCFGLAPNAHEDDAARAALAGLNICERLLDLGYRASVGITFGDVFCGVVGSRGRREYSILGDPVNLAARCMW
jgi:adenylate cyclase 10